MAIKKYVVNRGNDFAQSFFGSGFVGFGQSFAESVSSLFHNDDSEEFVDSAGVKPPNIDPRLLAAGFMLVLFLLVKD